MEVARVERTSHRLVADGTQLGATYDLRYRVTGGQAITCDGVDVIAVEGGLVARALFFEGIPHLLLHPPRSIRKPSSGN